MNEYDSSYGKWRISDNEEVNWWAFHEGLSGSPATVTRMLDGGCTAVDKR